MTGAEHKNLLCPAVVLIQNIVNSCCLILIVLRGLFRSLPGAAGCKKDLLGSRQQQQPRLRPDTTAEAMSSRATLLNTSSPR